MWILIISSQCRPLEPLWLHVSAVPWESSWRAPGCSSCSRGRCARPPSSARSCTPPGCTWSGPRRPGWSSRWNPGSRTDLQHIHSHHTRATRAQRRRKVPDRKFPEFSRLLRSRILTCPEVIATKVNVINWPPSRVIALHQLQRYNRSPSTALWPCPFYAVNSSFTQILEWRIKTTFFVTIFPKVAQNSLRIPRLDKSASMPGLWLAWHCTWSSSAHVTTVALPILTGKLLQQQVLCFANHQATKAITNQQILSFFPFGAQK